MATGIEACVFIYGRELLLLKARRQMLRREGFRVVAISHLDELSLVRAKEFRVFVLCHTLSVDEQEEAVKVGHQANSEIKMILLTALKRRFSRAISCSFLNHYDGPEALIALVREALWGIGGAYPSFGDAGPVSLSTLFIEEIQRRKGWLYTGSDFKQILQASLSTHDSQADHVAGAVVSA